MQQINERIDQQISAGMMRLETKIQEGLSSKVQNTLNSNLETIVSQTMEKAMGRLLDGEASPLLGRFKGLDRSITELRADVVSSNKDMKKEVNDAASAVLTLQANFDELEKKVQAVSTEGIEASTTKGSIRSHREGEKAGTGGRAESEGAE